MNAILATFGTVAAVLALMSIDRDRVRLSKAIWIPLIWLLIGTSRPVSNWMTFSSPTSIASSYEEGSPLDRNLLSLLLLLAVIVLSQRGRQLSRILQNNIPIVIFLAYCGLSTVWGDYPFVGFKRWIRAVGDCAMVCIILTELHPSDALKRVMMWIAMLWLPLSLLFIRFFPSLGRIYSITGTPMWTGVATDKNALGALCMITGAALLARTLTVWKNRAIPKRSTRLAVILTLLLMVLYLLAIIDSKTALACFVMSATLISMRLLGPAFVRPGLLAPLVIAMIGVCYAVLFMGVGSDALNEMGRDTSLTGRTRVWEIVLPWTVNPWIGAGYENFWIGDRLEAISREVDAHINQAHNGYLELYLNIGWVGLFLLSCVVVHSLARILKGLPHSLEMGTLKLSFFVICLVYNFTEAAFKIQSPVWILFLWATMDLPGAPRRVLASQTHPPAEDRRRVGTSTPGYAIR